LGHTMRFWHDKHSCVNGPSDAGSKRNLGHSQCADPRLRLTGGPGTAWRNCSGGGGTPAAGTGGGPGATPPGTARTGGTAAAAAAPAAAIFTTILATDTHQYIGGCACKRALSCMRARVCVSVCACACCAYTCTACTKGAKGIEIVLASYGP
jgi:hypothetical protein